MTRRLLRDVAVFLALQVAIFAGLDLAFRRTHGANHFLASFHDKQERLQRTASPRILLVGGSSLAFGANSAALERATGRPVVNLAEHAGLGLDFLLAEAEDALRAGDLVVLSPEYRLLDTKRPIDTAVVQMQVLLAPSAARYVHARHLPLLLDTGLSSATIRILAVESVLRGDAPEALYNRAAFDERGDIVAHHRYATRFAGNQHAVVTGPEEADGTGDALAGFARRARAAGADVVLCPPPLPEDDYGPQRPRAQALWSRLSQESGIEVRARNRAYPRSLFFDTSYHLTLEGKRLRTRSLVQVLRPILADGEARAARDASAEDAQRRPAR